jgi:hypothetical protein
MTLDLPQGSSLHDFIVELAKNRDSELLEKMMENGKKVHSKIKISVNGRMLNI